MVILLQLRQEERTGWQWILVMNQKIDNLVCDGGNGLVINGELLGIEPLDKNICLEIIDECIEKKFTFRCIFRGCS